jgi:hypothetical protein
MNKKISSPPTKDEKVISAFGIQRRNMLKFFGASAAVITLGTACNNDDDDNIIAGTINLGSGDTGILNYAYALEQLEAAFYIQVVTAANFTTIFPSVTEQLYLNDIRDHEVAHRQFFKTALGSNAIPGLTPNFSSVDFTTRAGVLAQAKAFEDTGVAAYNGAGKLITDPNYLVAAGKIVSVEARHAALIRDLISNGTFADDLDANAKDIEKTPAQVAAIANMYLAANSQLNGSNLPTS